MVVIVRFIIKEREETFTGAQRSHIVWQILLRTPYDQARPDKVGIVRLMNKNVYEACFPLHEGRHDRDGPQGEKSDRRVRLGSVLTPDRLYIKLSQLLYLQWAKWTNFYKRQPLWLIKRYFGDKVCHDLKF